MPAKKGKRKRERPQETAVETKERKAVELLDDARTAAEDEREPDGSASEAGAPHVEETDEATRLLREAAEWKDKFLRAKAEQQNAARRAAKELEEAVRYANGVLLKALLDVVDDFERTIEAARSSATVEAVLDGVKLVQGKVEKLLKEHDVECIDAENVPFDPTKHEALMRKTSAEHEPGTVIQQVQKGYQLRGRVLRPAKVIVAAAPTEEETAAAGESISEAEEQ